MVSIRDLWVSGHQIKQRGHDRSVSRNLNNTGFDFRRSILKIKLLINMDKKVSITARRGLSDAEYWRPCSQRVRNIKIGTES